MKYTSLPIAALAIFSASSATAQTEAPKVELEKAAERTPELTQKTSYGLGYQNGAQFASNGFNQTDFDTEAYLKGLLTGLAGKELELDTEEYRNAIKTLDTLIRKREETISAENLKLGAEFLAKNSKREGIITTKSGLQYEILTAGKGKTYQVPENTINGQDITTQFKVNCTGALLDGRKFLVTTEGKPATFSLNIIKGPAEALKLMPVGSKWKVYVPAELGFGKLRQGAMIAPNSTLVYELELLEIISVKLPSKPALPHDFKLNQ